MLAIVVPTKDRYINKVFESIPSDFYYGEKYENNICLCIVCDSCSTEYINKLHKDSEFYNTKIPTCIIATECKSPYKSRKMGVYYMLRHDTSFYEKYKPNITSVVFQDSDDEFTEDFWNWIKDNPDAWNKNNTKTVYTFGWIFKYLDESKPEYYWKPVDTYDFLKVPSMPCKIFPTNLLVDLFNVTPDPKTISGEEIDFLRNLMRFNEGFGSITYKHWVGKINIKPIDIPSAIAREHESTDKNETLSSYTEKQKFLSTFDNHVQKYMDAVFNKDEKLAYAYRKAIMDISSSYIKYSNDPEYCRIKSKEITDNTGKVIRVYQE